MGALEILIDRLEAAVGPDNELDADIERWVHNISGATGRILMPFGTKPFTSSVDAALTLIPNGHTWSIGTRDEKAWGSEAKARPYWAECGNVDTAASNPALALCTAALKSHLTK